MEETPDATHPIAQRLELLGAEWASFTERPEARLLCWLCEPDEVAMVEAFVARESEPEACTTPDLFLRFDAAFEHASGHGYALRNAALAACEQAGTPFVAPEAASQDDIGAFAAWLRAYHLHQQGQVAHLTAFLSPKAVRDPGGYRRWLQRLARACPEALRIVVTDSAGAPVFAELARQEPTLVVNTRCGLDMPSALEALSSAAGTKTPGAHFRQLFVQLGNKAKQVDLPGALALAGLAGKLAETMQCPHLAAGARLLLAGVYSAAGKPLEALRCYTEVDRYGIETHALAEKGSEGGGELRGEAARSYGLRLRRDARLGQGAVLIHQRAWERAAKVYLDAVAFSHLLSDARGELDALRLASFCHEQDGKREQAWQCGMRGLEVAGRMDEATRRSSTLRYLGESMLRLASGSSHSAYREGIDEHLQTFLGPGWRACLEQGSATP